MNKDNSHRKKFVKVAINNNKKAAKIVRRIADNLENSKNTTETVNHLAHLLYLSERTIIRDCS